MATIETVTNTTFSGRRFTRAQLLQIQETVQTFNKLSRNELALTLCEHLHWTNAAGKPKVNSCLDMLEQLESLGVVVLPARRSQHSSQATKQTSSSRSIPLRPYSTT